MAVRIRLKRMGATKRPFYRIIVADSRSSRDGRFIETLGHYDPLTEPATVKVQADRYQYWVSNGAQPSESVLGLLKRSGALEAPQDAAAPAPQTSARNRANLENEAAAAEARKNAPPPAPPAPAETPTDVAAPVDEATPADAEAAPVAEATGNETAPEETAPASE